MRTRSSIWFSQRIGNGKPGPFFWLFAKKAENALEKMILYKTFIINIDRRHFDGRNIPDQGSDGYADIGMLNLALSSLSIYRKKSILN